MGVHMLSQGLCSWAKHGAGGWVESERDFVRLIGTGRVLLLPPMPPGGEAASGLITPTLLDARLGRPSATTAATTATAVVAPGIVAAATGGWEQGEALARFSAVLHDWMTKEHALFSLADTDTSATEHSGAGATTVGDSVLDSGELEALTRRVVHHLTVQPGLEVTLANEIYPPAIWQPTFMLGLCAASRNLRVLTVGFVGEPTSGDRPDNKASPCLLRLASPVRYATLQLPHVIDLQLCSSSQLPSCWTALLVPALAVSVGSCMGEELLWAAGVGV